MAEVVAQVLPASDATPALTPARRSLLPAWLLASQDNLAKLTATHDVARQSIANLRTSIKKFDDMVEERTAPKPEAAREESEEEAEPRAEVGPHALPEDCGECVAEYCGGLDLLVYSITSAAAHVWLEAEAPWRAAHARQALDRCWWLEARDGAYRDAVMQHSAWTLEARSFVKEFGEQARSKRRADIEPRRYSRHEREVAHPLPGSGSQSGDVVARMHTLGVDGRRRALAALEAFALATASAEADAGPDLVSRGAVTILVAFLSNELGSIQDLAAGCLANLACGEVAQDDVLETMAACNARKPLVALLSSPSARVTLHQSSAPFAHLNRGPRARLAAKAQAFREREAYCQGMGCKNASRALCNACLPAYALALPPDGVGDRAPHGDDDLFERWDFYSFHSSGSFNHKSRILMNVRDGSVSGLGADNLGQFQLYGTARADHGALVLYFSKSYSAQPVRDVTQSGHIAHVAWSGNAPEEGFFGVWEVTSNDTHFELRRGGVFRVVPADDDVPTYGGVAEAEPRGARIQFPRIPGATPA